MMEEFDWFLLVFVTIIFILIGILIFSYIQQSNICEDFGGKILGDRRCYKNGNVYEIVNIANGFSNNYKIARYGASIE